MSATETATGSDTTSTATLTAGVSSTRLPMLINIIQHCKRIFHPKNAPASTQDFHALVSMVNHLSNSDLNLPADLLTDPHGYARRHPLMAAQTTVDGSIQPGAPCTYIPIIEHAHFTIAVFVLAPNVEMPLHDHPRMHGIVKCLSGHLLANSWSAINAEGRLVDQPIRRSDGAIDVRHETPLELFANSPAMVLTPSLHNYHRMQAQGGGAAAFLDVLAPPYHSPGGETRECTYYEILDGDQSGRTTTGDQKTYRLYPTQQTHWWCNFVPYEMVNKH